MPRTSISILCQLLLSVPLVMGMTMASAADALAPVDARYRLERGSMKLATARVTLKEISDDCYEYQHKTKPVMMVKLLFGEPMIRSEFCNTENGIRSLNFESRRDGVGSSKDNYQLSFDWDRRVAVDQGGAERKIDVDVYDELSMHIAIRREVIRAIEANREPVLEFRLIDRKRIKTYVFAIAGRESIRTPAGKFDTLKIQRTNDERRQTTLWLAPAMDYFPVQVEQQKDDDPELRLILESNEAKIAEAPTSRRRVGKR